MKLLPHRSSFPTPCQKLLPPYLYLYTVVQKGIIKNQTTYFYSSSKKSKKSRTYKRRDGILNFHTLDYDDSSVSKKFDSPNKISIATMTNLIKVKYSLNCLHLC
jgi:hypothetical protein